MPSKQVFAEAIGKRDHALFQFLHENKVATTKQLKDFIFPKNCFQVAYKRILALARAGWLDRGAHAGVGTRPENIYALTDKAYKAHVSEKISDVRRVQLKSGAIEHDLVLVDIRKCFEKNKAVKRFYPENLLQSSNEFAGSDKFRRLVDLRSDAAVDLLLADKHRFLVPLEYEASLKSIERCHQKLLDYYIKYDGKVVLFICKDDMIHRRFVSIEKKLSQEHKPKMYFALLSEILGKPEELTFTKAQGDKYIIK